jgi:hypothetical protein
VALCAANPAKPGLQQIALHFIPRKAFARLQIIAMPCSRTGHHCFAVFRPKLFC